MKTWFGARALTFGMYLMAVIGASSWDAEDLSSWKSAMRLVGSASFLLLAVIRTIRHVKEDDDREEAQDA